VMETVKADDAAKMGMYELSLYGVPLTAATKYCLALKCDSLGVVLFRERPC
jgi:hypothetical protein